MRFLHSAMSRSAWAKCSRSLIAPNPLRLRASLPARECDGTDYSEWYTVWSRRLEGIMVRPFSAASIKLDASLIVCTDRRRLDQSAERVRSHNRQRDRDEPRCFLGRPRSRFQPQHINFRQHGHAPRLTLLSSQAPPHLLLMWINARLMSRAPRLVAQRTKDKRPFWALLVDHIF